MTTNYLFFRLLKTGGKELDPDFKAVFELLLGYTVRRRMILSFLR
jgi:hypothetical protein